MGTFPRRGVVTGHRYSQAREHVTDAARSVIIETTIMAEYLTSSFHGPVMTLIERYGSILDSRQVGKHIFLMPTGT